MGKSSLVIGKIGSDTYYRATVTKRITAMQSMKLTLNIKFIYRHKVMKKIKNTRT